MLSKLIQDYKQKLNEYNEILNHKYECVFNTDVEEQLKNPSNLVGIVVMDNPGQEEKEQRKYLVGTAGKAFNKVFRSIGIKREDVLVFNKSSFTTPATGDLNALYKDEKVKQIFLEEQKLTSEIILKIQKELNLPIMLHGYAAYFKKGRKFVENEKGNRPLYVFFNIISKMPEIKNKIHFFKHSSYGNLSKQISAYCKELGVEKLTYDEYLELGIKNRFGFYDE